MATISVTDGGFMVTGRSLVSFFTSDGAFNHQIDVFQLTESDATKSKDVQQQQQIVATTVSRRGRLVAILGADKKCAIYDSAEKRVLRVFTVPKVATAADFDDADEFLTVADRSGNAARYSVTGVDPVEPHLDPNGIECRIPCRPLLGHVSMILDIAVRGQRVYTVDRDEKVRLSHYPNAFEIEAYGLGHTEYVSSIQLVGEYAVTSGGDGTVRIWNAATLNQVAASEPLGDAVDHFAAFSQEGALHVCLVLKESAELRHAHWSPTSDKVQLSGVGIKLDSPALDVAARNGGFVVINANGIRLWNNFDTEPERVVEFPNDLAKDVEQAKQSLPDLAKRSYDTVDEFHERLGKKMKRKKH